MLPGPRGLGWVSAANLRKPAPAAPGNGARRAQSIYRFHGCVANISLTLTSWASLETGPDVAGLSPHILSVLAVLPCGVSLHSSLAFSGWRLIGFRLGVPMSGKQHNSTDRN